MPRKTKRATFSPPSTDIFDVYSVEDYPLRSARAIAFIEGECKVPSGRNAGKPYKLLPFQKDLLRKALDGDAITCIWSLPRGAGKTGLAAPLLVFFLFEAEGSQVVAASTSMRTARLGYDRAVRIIESSPRLAEQALIHYNAANPYVDMPHRGSQMFPLPAEEKHIVGMSPSVVLVDEVGYVSHETFEAMQTSLGKVDGSLLLGIGTPGLGTTDGDRPNLMYYLRTLHGSEDKPDGLVYVEYAADKQDDPEDPKTWKRANPGLGILVDPKALALDYATLPLSRFAQMRLGLWTQQESAWMRMEDWDALTVESGPIRDGATITLGFDGSTSGDTTALCAYEMATGRVSVLGVWERPKSGAKGWKVPRGDVMSTIDKAFTNYNVITLFADPWHWRSELEELESQYGEQVVSFNTAAPQRMGPAADAFRVAVQKGELTWDGNEVLRAHILSAIAKKGVAGDVLQKDARNPQHIDLAIAAILAFEASNQYVEPPQTMVF